MTAEKILLILVAVGMCCVFFAWGYEARKRVEQRQRESEADPLYVEPPSRWHALPGNRLELAATGFAIEHKPEDVRADFFLYAPEGRFVCAVAAGNLAALKHLAERMAAERDEFAPAHVQSFPAIGPGSNRNG